MTRAGEDNLRLTRAGHNREFLCSVHALRLLVKGKIICIDELEKLFLCNSLSCKPWFLVDNVSRAK